MKLTEKELNEFPIGTMLITNIWYIIKTDCNEGYKNWYRVGNNKVNGWYNANTISEWDIDTIHIPKQYKEYIPPKPILDDKEKEYLSAVIRPWRKKVRCICKKEYGVTQYIRICLIDEVGVDFPYFKEGTMYKGMELDKEYTLEELGL